MKTHLKSLFEWIWPRYCLICKEITREAGVCRLCQNKLPWNIHACYQCGLPLENKPPQMHCGACITNPPPYEQTLALFVYQPPITQFITQLKFHRHLEHAYFLGTALSDHIEQHYKNNSLPTCIIPIPLHPQRLRKRGFNQAIEIAKPVSKKLGIPLMINHCIRKKRTHAQSELPAKKRADNIKNAFAIQKTLHAKHIAIIDDVMTTGSTVRELSYLLKQNGVEKIDVWCCARAARFTQH